MLIRFIIAFYFFPTSCCLQVLPFRFRLAPKYPTKARQDPLPLLHSAHHITERSRHRGSQSILFAKNEKPDKDLWAGVMSLWDEIIEVSTYGPSERKMLKAQRERQKQIADTGLDLEDSLGENIGLEDDRAWMEAFAAARDKEEDDDYGAKQLDYDGYALQDLLVSKWGVSLDVDFQRIGDQIYCTVLPLIGFGSPLRSRHNTELDYLMHLQGVVEVLHKYDNLDGFVGFIQTTRKIPKRGTDSMPFRLNLNNEDMDRIMQK